MSSGESKNILVTGAAGFIGFHLSRKLAAQGHHVLGIDNLNDYYDVRLKESRLQVLSELKNFSFARLDLTDRNQVSSAFKGNGINYVIHLAAQAGVRYSIENPYAYLESNLKGFLNILEACRHHKPDHLIYASSSSVYGANTQLPFSVHDNVDHPISLYAATKKSNELMAHTYSSLYGLPTTGLRFFTVYGPWGRPDMALFIFTKSIIEGRPIEIFNEGKMERDFTYIDDIVEGIVRLIPQVPVADPQWDPAKPDPSTSFAPYRIYNIGNNSPIKLMTFIELIEKAVGKKAVKTFKPMQDGDVRATFADIDALTEATGFKPSTPIEEGIHTFVKWYREYYNVSI